MSKSKAGATDIPAVRVVEQGELPPAAPGRATRETVESIAVAVILAFLFRAFVAEAFVIPTGSMAPTLMGQHKDVECPECHYWYQAGASIEIEDEANDQRLLELGRAPSRSVVIATTCPLCRYRQVLDLEGDANKATFSGDRILVSKFIYDFASPQRWDVIVFKYPFNAKQNFIKRLVGLPGETLLIKQGDVFIKEPEDADFEIARKPDHKLKAMLQLVYDTKYISQTLHEVGWPARWQAWAEDHADVTGFWQSEDEGHSYNTVGAKGQDIWLRYHHVIPSLDDWNDIRTMAKAGERLATPSEIQGGLITDFYAYNAFTSIDRFRMRSFDPELQPEEYARPIFGSPSLQYYGTLGLHWVGDLAVETEVEIQSDDGQLLLQLTKGGLAYFCRIDVATGEARLEIGDGSTLFEARDGTTADSPAGQTRVRGPGRYTIRYSNVDAELRLWVDDRRVQFDGPTTYLPRDDAQPVTTPQDPGDLAPVGIGTREAALQVSRLRVLRDVYYVATDGRMPHEYRIPYGPQKIMEILNDPTTWEATPLFEARDVFQHTLADDQFLPLGDNSPQSSDARMWQDHYFVRDMLIGRALLIYWPHPWYRPIPYLPNITRMRLIQ